MEESFGCNDCGRKFKSEDCLQWHEKKHTLSSFCDICYEKLNERDSMDFHIGQCHQAGPYHCICKEGHDSLDSLREHKKTCRQHKKKLSLLTAHVCSLCTGVFPTEKALTAHHKKKHLTRMKNDAKTKKSKLQVNVNAEAKTTKLQVRVNAKSKTTKKEVNGNAKAKRTRLQFKSPKKKSLRVNLSGPVEDATDDICRRPGDSNSLSDLLVTKNDEMAADMKAVCDKYKSKGLDVLVLVTDQTHCRWFGTPAASNFVTEAYQFIFKFFYYCREASTLNKKNVKLKTEIPNDQVNKSREEPQLATEIYTDIAIDSDATVDADVPDDMDIDNRDLVTDVTNGKTEGIKLKFEDECEDTFQPSDHDDDENILEESFDIKTDNETSAGVDNDFKVIQEFLKGKSDGKYSCLKCGSKFIHEGHLRTHENKIPACHKVKHVPKSSNDLLKEEVTFKHPDTKEDVTMTFQDIIDKQKESGYCLLCGRYYTGQEKYKLFYHTLQHNETPIFRCNICGKSFNQYKNLQMHTRQHIKKPWDCASCPRRFERAGPCKAHSEACTYAAMTAVAEEPTLKCDQCNYTSPNEIVMMAHKTSHDGEMICVCTLCGKQVNSLFSLSRHVHYVHRDERPYKCELCTESVKTFKTKDGLNRHIKTHGNRINICNICGKGFTEKGNLSAHIKTHSDVRPHVCDICGKSFKKKAYFDNHRRIHTGDAPYKCKIEGCGKAFRCGASLTQHLRTHGPGAYICDICGRTFKQPNALGHHRKGHTVEWRWPCSYCSEKYNSIWKFKRHLANCHADKKEEIQRLTNIKLHQCTICQKMFHDSEDFIRHVNNHNGVKPFKCEECGKTYSDRSNLKTHMFTHTGGKKYRCLVCNSRFLYDKNLIAHIKRKHPKRLPSRGPCAENLQRDWQQDESSSDSDDSLAPLQLQIHE